MDTAIAELRARGLIQGIINEDALASASGPVYAGFDATARSLHVGHLVVLRTLSVFRDHGVPVIGLVGEGTARVGDPSFRTTERQMMTADAVSDNALPIRQTLDRFLGGEGAEILSNGPWLGDLNLLEFLTDTGKHFTMSRMLSFESVSARLGAGLTFLEFAYMLLQARDFLELHDRFGCDVQVGGSDQWANILCGTDLIRKTRGATTFGITAPLLTRSDGKKMGKSGGHAVWLDPAMTPDFDFWQFWRNTPDADVGRFLLTFTDIPVSECVRLGALGGQEVNAAKVALADAVTRLVRGADAADAARKAAETGAAEGEVPVVALDGTVPLFRALVLSGTVPSAKAAKRAVSEGVRVDGVRMTDPNAEVGAGAVLTFGKRMFRLEAAS